MSTVFFSNKNGVTSPWGLTKAAIIDIAVELETTEPQSTNDLATAIGAIINIATAACEVMAHRLEIIRAYDGLWWLRTTVHNGIDALGTEAQSVYDFIQTNPASSQAQIIAGTSLTQNEVALYLKELIARWELWEGFDEAGTRRYATKEQADSYLTNTILQTTYSDLVSNEGSTLSEAAARLYPGLALNKAELLVRRQYLCIEAGHGLVKIHP